MPAAPKDKGETNTTGSAQGRFTTQLADAVGSDLDRIAEHMSKAMFDLHGLSVKPTRPDIIRALVSREVQRLDEAAKVPEGDPAEIPAP